MSAQFLKLASPLPIDEAEAFLLQMKTAGAADVAKKTTEFVRAHAPEIAASLVGGAVAVGAQYLQNKPGKDGSPSATQAQANLAHKAVKGSLAKDKARGKEPGVGKQVAGATTKAVQEIADIFAKNPGKGALMALPVGMAAGPVILKKLTKTASKEKVALPIPSVGAMKGVAKSVASKGSSLLRKASPGVGKAMQSAVTTGLGKRMAVGAAGGAALGAMKNPGVDPQTGQKNSRLQGAVAGAALGAGAGAAAGVAAKGLASMNNAVGKYTGGALTRAAKQSGNAQALSVGRDAAMARGAAARGGALASPMKNAPTAAAKPKQMAMSSLKLSPQPMPQMPQRPNFVAQHAANAPVPAQRPVVQVPQGATLQARPSQAQTFNPNRPVPKQPLV